MPATDFRNATGKLLFGGHSGTVYQADAGKIYFAKAPIRGIDENLWGLLKHLVTRLHISMTISSIDTGKHVVQSRHYRNCAGDISGIATTGREIIPVTSHNPDAVRLADYLYEVGWKNREGGNWGAVLLGLPGTERNGTKVDHSDHIHLSIAGPR